jgi:DNA polymerase III sliding clamp (beta) subunit (PCNA family)
MLIDKRAASIAVACSDETGREKLQGVHVRPDGKLEASNGHILLQVAGPDIPDVEAPAAWNAGADMRGKILSAESLKAVVKALPKKSNLPILMCAGIGPNGSADSAKAVYGLNGDGGEVSVKLIPGEYPNTAQVWPKGEPVLKVAFAGKYLGMLAKLAEVEVTFTFYGPDVAALVECSGERPITGLLMPLRIKA